MIATDANTISIWQAAARSYSCINKPAVTAIYDVIIVGGGITGICTAMQLQQAGKKCLVLEARNICFGTTGGTTAHINTLLDTPYSTIEKNFGKDKAALVASAAAQAIDLIRANINAYAIDCGLQILMHIYLHRTKSKKMNCSRYMRLVHGLVCRSIMNNRFLFPSHLPKL